MAVAKWRTLSDAEKEEWRVKPRKSAGGGGGGFQKVKYMQTRGFGGGEGDAEMLSISSVRMLGRMFGHFFFRNCERVAVAEGSSDENLDRERNQWILMKETRKDLTGKMTLKMRSAPTGGKSPGRANGCADKFSTASDAPRLTCRMHAVCAAGAGKKTQIRWEAVHCLLMMYLGLKKAPFSHSGTS